MRVTLVQTAARDGRGSMRRYADLVAEAVASVDVTRVFLAPDSGFLAALPASGRGWARHAAVASRARAVLPSVDADVVHLLDGSHAYVARWLPADVRLVVTSHDLIPLLQAVGRLAGPRPGRLAEATLRESVRRLESAAVVVADSSSTRDDLVRETAVGLERVRVVHPALPLEWTTDPPPPALNRRPGSRVLHVGHDAFYKNREGVLRIFARVVRRVDAELVMVGPPPDSARRELVSELGLEGRVSWRTEATDGDLRFLYRSARVFLFPSLYEGFGWPPLEAMANGCPVVCSCHGSLAEVAGPAALTAPAEDEEALADHCVRLLRDPDEAERVAARSVEHAATFTLDRMGRQTLDAYRAALP